MSYEAKGIYKFLWAFLMLIGSIYDFLNHLLLKIRSYPKQLKNKLFAPDILDINLVINYSKILTKIPNHLSVIIGSSSTQISPEILSKLAVYALVSDINFISFYDVRNQFTLDQVKIPKYISAQKIRNGRFLWTMPKDKTNSAQLKYKNGLERSIEVISLTRKDGKPLLAEVCKEICADRNTKEVQDALQQQEKFAEKINKTLQKKLNNLPNPEVVMIFDKTLCTYGLLPWHTGFSEFHLIDNGQYLNAEMFLNILCKFSKCEQRFGR